MTIFSKASVAPSVDFGALGTRTNLRMTDAMNAAVEISVLVPLRVICAKPGNDNGAATPVDLRQTLRSAIWW